MRNRKARSRKRGGPWISNLTFSVSLTEAIFKNSGYKQEPKFLGFVQAESSLLPNFEVNRTFGNLVRLH